MDVLSERGQTSLADERRAIEIFSYNYPKYFYMHTPKNMPATVDALLMISGELYSCVETKCRTMTLDDFYGRFRGRWLVTYDKIEKARQIAVSLGVRLTGFLYLKGSDTLLVADLANADGLFSRKMYIEATETQKTINGGLAVRNNAYIDMTGATRLVI